jgi:DNA-directed RNA polymerase subunit RPC12/RpoP
MAQLRGNKGFHMIKVRCSACSKRYRLDDRYKAKLIRCSQCGHVFRVTEDVSDWLAALNHVTAEYGHWDAEAHEESTPRRARASS